MAQDKPQNKAQEAGTQAGGKRKLPLKTVVIVAAALLIEAVAIIGAFVLGGGPEAAQADGAAFDAAALAEQPVELLVVAEKFQNTRTGRTYLYDTEVYIVVKQKHEAEVASRIDRMKAQISTTIATVFRRAEPAHLHEPELSTLTRQVLAELRELVGYDRDGEPLVQEALIRKATQYRADM